VNASARLVDSRDERPRHHRVSAPNESADGDDDIDRRACLRSHDPLDLADFTILGEDGVADTRLGDISAVGAAFTRTRRYGVSCTCAGCFEKIHVPIVRQRRGDGSLG